MKKKKGILDRVLMVTNKHTGFWWHTLSKLLSHPKAVYLVVAFMITTVVAYWYGHGAWDFVWFYVTDKVITHGKVLFTVVEEVEESV